MSTQYCSTRSAYNDFEQAAMVWVTWSFAESLSFTTTPSTVSLLTRSMSLIIGGGGLVLLLHGHRELWKLFQETWTGWVRGYLLQPSRDVFQLALAGVRVQLQVLTNTANLRSSFSVLVGRKLEALTKYDAGPIADPWMTLAEIPTRSDVFPANRVQWEWSSKKSFSQLYTSSGSLSFASFSSRVEFRTVLNALLKSKAKRRTYERHEPWCVEAYLLLVWDFPVRWIRSHPWPDHKRLELLIGLLTPEQLGENRRIVSLKYHQ